MPPFGSLRSYEQLDAVASRYHVRPSDLAHERDPYRAYCLDEACALAGEALGARLIETLKPAEPPARRVDGRLIGTFHREA